MRQPIRFTQKMAEKSKTRRGEILAAALTVATDRGYLTMTCTQVAAAAGCVHGTVFSHFETMGHLRDAVMRQAVAEGCAEVVLQGMVTGHIDALRAPPEVKQSAITLLDQ